jgi:hypothetical protein
LRDFFDFFVNAPGRAVTHDRATPRRKKAKKALEPDLIAFLEKSSEFVKKA